MGSRKGKTYPDGPWGPESHIQRGGIVYDFRVPGDPLTPGWASVPGAKRIRAAEAVSLPKIISAPLSWRDAQVILDALEGPEAPPQWKGATAGRIPGRRRRRDRAHARADRQQGAADLDGDRAHHRQRDRRTTS